MGGEVVWWVVVLVLTCLAPLLLLLYFQPTPLPSLLIPNPPHSPLIGWVSPPFVVGCVLVADKRDTSTCCVWWRFQTPTILNRNFNFHCSISYSDTKIMKIIVYILYIYKDVSTILHQTILICGGVYMVISFQSYEISIYIEKTCWF
jgi:hypothetical protein